MWFRVAFGCLIILSLIFDVSALDLYLPETLESVHGSRDQYIRIVSTRRPSNLNTRVYQRPRSIVCSLIGPGTFIAGLHAGKLR